MSGTQVELKSAMSASSVSAFSHPIGILMSAAGRFVVCIDCHLSVEFPAGAHYNIIARQFESHVCGCPQPLKDDALSRETITADAATSEALNRCDFDFCEILSVAHLLLMMLTTTEFHDMNFFMTALG